MFRLIALFSLMLCLSTCGGQTNSSGDNESVSGGSSSNDTTPTPISSNPSGGGGIVFECQSDSGCSGSGKCISTSHCTFFGSPSCDCVPGGNLRVCSSEVSNPGAPAGDCTVANRCGSALYCHVVSGDSAGKCRIAATAECATSFDASGNVIAN
ncbi:MAG: hypothetical protein JKY15_07395 [Deltaproteobacteria bacterium]|nr:hypothetical protein [Deltaproteobacteria bacterium]